MANIEITFRLPERLVNDAQAMGMLSDEHIAELLRADIDAQMSAIGSDPEIPRENAQINAEFIAAEEDGLNTSGETANPPLTREIVRQRLSDMGMLSTFSRPAELVEMTNEEMEAELEDIIRSIDPPIDADYIDRIIGENRGPY